MNSVPIKSLHPLHSFLDAIAHQSEDSGRNNEITTLGVARF